MTGTDGQIFITLSLFGPRSERLSDSLLNHFMFIWLKKYSDISQKREQYTWTNERYLDYTQFNVDGLGIIHTPSVVLKFEYKSSGNFIN